MKKGFTLIELLLSMVILSTLLLAFTQIYYSGIKTFREELTRTQLQSEGQILLDRISTEIKEARYTENTYGSYTLNSSTLILDIPAIDANKNIIYAGSAPLVDRVIYYANGSTLHRVVYANPNSFRMGENENNKTLTTNLSQLNLTYTYKPGGTVPNAINVRINLVKKIGNRNQTISVSSTAIPRNMP